jgi:membrane associated rhomboid family serine protease
MTAPDVNTPGGQEVPPTCYRHPDRETWVSCVRCGRHACPDCLRQAAVGQQCVECIRGASQGSRQARTAFGGQVVGRATVTWTLVALNVLVFLAELAKPNLLYNLGMLGLPANSPAGVLHGVAGGDWYRLLTSAFTAPGTSISGLGFLDIALNMWALIIVGPQLERVLGRSRFLGVYLLSAIGGSVLYFYLAPSGLAAGASGAIFGLFGAYFVLIRKLRLDPRGILLLIAINLAFSFIYHSTIAWQDHIGGLIVGALTMAGYAYAPARHRTLVQVLVTVVVLALLILAVVIKSAMLAPQLPPGF